MNHRIAVALGVVCAVACGEDPQNSTGLWSETTDSVGIRIVENVRPPEGSRLDWRIGPKPTLSIGTREGEDSYLLHLVRDATKLPDGRIVIANRGTGEMRVFDASGTHVATWGGRGEGPGEFDDLTYVEPWPGDSIAAWFAPGMAISVFDSDGNFARTFQLADDTWTPPWRRFWPLASTRGGSILSAMTPEGTNSVVFQLNDGEGRVRSPLGSHPGTETRTVNAGTDRQLSFGSIFGGRAVWEPWGDLVVIGFAGRYEFKAFDGSGTLTRVVRRGHEPRAPTGDEIEAEIRTRPLVAQEGSEPTRLPYRSAPVAEHFPAFASLLSDAVDHLWVREYDFPGEKRPGPLWTVFDPGGRVLGFVETPEGLRIYEIGEDYILGHSMDELGVEMIQVWPLERRGDGARLNG